MYYRLYILTIIVLFLTTNSSRAQLCKDYLIHDGSEAVSSYGIDTTGNWYAVTQTFSNRYKLIVNGTSTDTYLDFKNFKFSPDGKRWAGFAKTSSGWDLIASDTMINITATNFGDVVFSTDSKSIAFSYYDGDDEYISINGNRMKTYMKSGELKISRDGKLYAYPVKRSGYYYMNINGKESNSFESVIPIGFWHDGAFMYVGQYGTNAEIYKNDHAVSEAYVSIKQTVMNINGNALAALVNQSSGFWTSVYYSDEYTEPLIGNNYDSVDGLTMPPGSDLYAFNAIYNQNHFVVLNGAEYAAEEDASAPYFTHDASEMFFLSCRINCILNVNGKVNKLIGTPTTTSTIARKPGSTSIAYPSSTGMLIMDYSKEDLYAGMIFDEVSAPIYNWRTDLYESIGRINERLYLLTCRP